MRQVSACLIFFILYISAHNLKKLSLIWILLPLLFTSCQQKKVPITPGKWFFYKKAYNFLFVNKDSAFYYFNRSATSTSSKQEAALAYQNMALIQSDAGDDYGAQESLVLGLNLLDAHDLSNRVHFADDYNQLGITFSNLNEFAQALNYYQRAFSYADDLELRAHLLNNEGNTYKDLKYYSKAISAYKNALRMVSQNKDAYARVLTNLAFAKWLQNPQYNPVPELLRGLAIRVREKNVPGENSSYAHLSDFYLKSHPDSALFYAQKMLVVAGQLRNADDQLHALHTLILLSPTIASKEYFQRYQFVNDSVQTKRSAARSQFAVIRYNVAQAKVENLALQNENTTKRYQLLAVLAFASLAGIGTVWWYRKRKQHIQLQADNKINESKLKLSQKVHDQVANGVYRIMSEVEHNEDLDKTRLLDQLDSMYEVSRNIAHDNEEPMEDFNVRVGALLNALKTPAIRLAITGNEPELWQNVGEEVKKQLELVLQELMVNMNKHSQATQAHIGFAVTQDQLKISYRDNGIGLNHQNKKGKGLENTVSRIVALKGSINFESPAEKGLGIEILVSLKK